ncbi:MAG TPA: TIGR02453 family protein [Gemmatimonadales bacterium]|nr:TIGR02453 family protein [Gemmatimonadales bacterium]
MPHAPWSVYILRCADNSFYTGIARDVAARVRAHGGPRGAAYTRARGPVQLVYQEAAADRSAALRREYAIKQLSRPEKEALVTRTDTSAGFPGFRPAALTFFRKLARNNTKAFFEAHKPIFQAEVQQPLKALVEEVDVAFARFAPEITGNPKRSLFRIYRDVRFSKDKSPYKTHAACWFYHMDAGRGVGGEAEGGAGFYFHFAPREILIAAGIWMPPRPLVQKIREAIVEDQRGFEKLVDSPAFKRRYRGLDTEGMLKRMPRGFAEDHPAARWLRYQSFTVARMLTERELFSPRLVRILAKDYEALTPYVRWLNRALGYREMRARI